MQPPPPPPPHTHTHTHTVFSSMGPCSWWSTSRALPLEQEVYRVAVLAYIRNSLIKAVLVVLENLCAGLCINRSGWCWWRSLALCWGQGGISLTTVSQQEERPIRQILYLGNLLETCHFQSFWTSLEENRELIDGITGFEDSVRKFICHVVGITYQTIDRRLLAEMLGDPLDTQVKVWMNKYGWTENEDGQIFIFNQEESVKPKNIVEKIDFESVSSIMATSQ
uniref:Eukaryotic translation initiation factor 3 subunit K n=1 Tax=Maylandia zebra TaxID=106582 RepID=A0A3P9DG13_9CICH